MCRAARDHAREPTGLIKDVEARTSAQWIRRTVEQSVKYWIVFFPLDLL